MILLSLSGCNFKPLYGKQGHNASCLLSSVNINLARNNEENRKVLHYINSAFNQTCNETYQKKYDLTISPFKSDMGVLFIKTGEATRKTVNVNIHYKLVKIDDGYIIAQGNVENSDTYTTLNSPYNEFIAYNNSIDNASSGAVNLLVNRITQVIIKQSHEN